MDVFVQLLTSLCMTLQLEARGVGWSVYWLVGRSVGLVGSVGFQGRRNPDPEPGIRDSPEPQQQHQGSVSSLFLRAKYVLWKITMYGRIPALA